MATPADDPQTRYEQTDLNSYGSYKVESTFDGDHGVAIMPLARRVAGNRMIRLHGGYGVRRVQWRAERAGVPPTIPQMVDTVADTLLSSSMTVPLPSPNAAGRGYDWIVQGEYIFGQNDLRIAGTDPFPSGAYPWVDQPQESIRAAQAGPLVQAAFDAAANGQNPNAALIEAVASDCPIVLIDGIIFWPWTSIPSIMSSNNIILG